MVRLLGHEPYCFAIDSDYIKDEKELMERALGKIDESDIIILESSQASFGVGIEGGFAFSKGKKIISASKEGAEVSNTIKGISDHFLIYTDFEDLSDKLRHVL